MVLFLIFLNCIPAAQWKSYHLECRRSSVRIQVATDLVAKHKLLNVFHSHGDSHRLQNVGDCFVLRRILSTKELLLWKGISIWSISYRITHIKISPMTKIFKTRSTTRANVTGLWRWPIKEYHSIFGMHKNAPFSIATSAEHLSFTGNVSNSLWVKHS